MKYCYNHAMPEVHGCGDEAKKHARAEVRSNGRGLSANPNSFQWFKAQEQTHKAKPLNADKRAVLQRELDKKIDKATEGRSKKQPARKK